MPPSLRERQGSKGRTICQAYLRAGSWYAAEYATHCRITASSARYFSGKGPSIRNEVNRAAGSKLSQLQFQRVLLPGGSGSTNRASDLQVEHVITRSSLMCSRFTCNPPTGNTALVAGPLVLRQHPCYHHNGMNHTEVSARPLIVDATVHADKRAATTTGAIRRHVKAQVRVGTARHTGSAHPVQAAPAPPSASSSPRENSAPPR